MAAKKVAEVKTIPGLRLLKMNIEIVGVTPLIAHRFSEAAAAAIEKKQQAETVAKEKLPPRDPEQEFMDARYLLETGEDVFPSLALKLAMLNEAKNLGFTRTRLCQAVHVADRWLRLKAPEPTMGRDRVLIGGWPKVATVAYRPYYWPWACVVPFLIDVDLGVKPEEIVNLVNRAGFHFGIGDWRVEKEGDYGKFEVAGVSYE